MNRASGSTCSRSPGRQKKRQSSSKPSGARVLSWPATCGRPESGRKLVNAPSRLLDREPQHLAPQRRER